MNQKTFTELTPEELRLLIKEVLKEVIKTILGNRSEEPDSLLTRKEAAKFLGISLVTLRDWTKLGYLQSQRIGTKVYYSRHSLLNLGKPTKPE